MLFIKQRDDLCQPITANHGLLRPEEPKNCYTAHQNIFRLMKIEIKRLDDAFHLQASNESGLTLEADGAEAIGGHNLGMRPMQMVLSALGSCSAIDVILILRKQRQQLEDIHLTITAEREKDKTPSLFTDIHIHYQLYGPLDDKKVKRAVDLSMEKLCSVKLLLEKTANITWSWEVLG